MPIWILNVHVSCDCEFIYLISKKLSVKMHLVCGVERKEFEDIFNG